MMQDVVLNAAGSFGAKDRPLLMPETTTASDALVNVSDDALSDSDSDESAPLAFKDSWAPISLIVFAFIVTSVFVYLFFEGDRLFRAASVIFSLMEQNPFAGFVAFVALYTFNALMCLPVFPLILGVGFVTVRANGIFPGIPLACLEVAVAAAIAATTVYLVGRNACRSQVARLSRRSKIVHVEELLMKHKGLQIVALLRMAAFLPFGASSYVLSATGVRFRDYILGTLLGLSPFIIAEVSAGASLSSLSYASVTAPNMNAPVEEHISKLQYFLFGFSFCLAMFSSWYISRLASAELRALNARHAASQRQKVPDLATYKSFVENEFSHQPEQALAKGTS